MTLCVIEKFGSKVRKAFADCFEAVAQIVGMFLDSTAAVMNGLLCCKLTDSG
jgi:hypothetical protein